MMKTICLKCKKEDIIFLTGGEEKKRYKCSSCNFEWEEERILDIYKTPEGFIYNANLPIHMGLILLFEMYIQDIFKRMKL